MTKHTFNKSNWSGESATIKVWKSGAFYYNGERIELVEKDDANFPGTLMEVMSDGRKVATVSRYKDEGEWNACSCFAEGFERSDAVPQVAVAKLLSNI